MPTEGYPVEVYHPNSNDYIPRYEFHEELVKITQKLNDHDKQIYMLQAVVDSLSGLPEAINNLDKTMALMQASLESLSGKVESIYTRSKERNDKQDKLLEEVEEKSKVDFVQYIKDNFFQLFLSLAFLLFAIKQYSP